MTSPEQKEAARTCEREEDAEPSTLEQLEASKFLQIKRWDDQSGPFRGFGSPPGRF